MISALLLPLLVAGEPGPVQPAAVKHDDPPIQLWISNDRRFLPGERAKVQVRSENDGYLIVLHVDPEGYLRVLFPLDPDKDNFIRGDKKYEVRGRGDREAFETDAKGRGTIYAAVSRDPFRFDGLVVGDHWDYRALAPSRLSNNPETELNELVRRMAQGDFDYDLLNYDVIDRSSYASSHSSVYPTYFYNTDPWCYSFSCGRPYGTSISIFFGRPYRRYYYDPYFYAYDPFYNPFFYDPYYYAPAYYPRYVYPRHYYNYPYSYPAPSDYRPFRGGYYSPYRNYARPYTPYRFRGDDFGTPYRDRRFDPHRSVNTVYNPPVSTVRDPGIAAPARRVVEPAGEELPSGRRPLIDDVRRVQGRPVEARRARPEDRAVERSSGEPRLIRREVEARPARESRPSSSDDPRRDAVRTNDAPRDEPRAVRSREEPRQIDRSAREPDNSPRREVNRGSGGPPPDRGGGRAEGRSAGGGAREAGGSRPSGGDGGRRRR